MRTTNGAGGITGTAKLANLMADISRVLARFDPEPIALRQGVSAENLLPGTDAAPRTRGGPAPSRTNPDSRDPGVRKRQELASRHVRAAKDGHDKAIKEVAA